MSFTNQTKSRIIDPRTFVNSRAVFHFDSNKVFLSNMKLINLGYNGTNKYNTVLGAHQVVKQMTLYDGNKELSKVRNYDLYMGFKNLLNTNENNRSLDSSLLCNNLGFKVVGLEVPGQGQRIGCEDLAKKVQDDNKAWVYLKSVFPLLEALPFVSTDENNFNNLRLVVEFNPLPAGSTLERPLVVCEEVIDEAVADRMVKNMPDILPYFEIEHDLMVIPAVTGLANTVAGSKKQQNISQQVKGFSNKYVQRLAFVKQSTDASAINTAVADKTSCGQYEENFNLQLNGQQMLADGLNRRSKAIAMLNDTMGVFNTPYIFVAPQQVAIDRVATDTEDIVTIGTATNAGVNEMVNKLDYKAFNIRSPVDNLQVLYQRTGLYSATDQTFAQKLNLHMFGEVRKAWQRVPSGGYVISYA